LSVATGWKPVPPKKRLHSCHRLCNGREKTPDVFPDRPTIWEANAPFPKDLQGEAIQQAKKTSGVFFAAVLKARERGGVLSVW
jgi:hypothetical protein